MDDNIKKTVKEGDPLHPIDVEDLIGWLEMFPKNEKFILNGTLTVVDCNGRNFILEGKNE